jgi:hypothetical protein
MRLASISASLRALGLFLVALATGCAHVRAVGKSPLAPPAMLSDSIAVEKYSVRFNHGDVDLDERIWSEIDEECLPAELRARLAANGFRAGIVGAHLPEALDRALRANPDDATAESPPPNPLARSAEIPGILNPKPVDLLHEPTVRHSLWQTRAGIQGIVVTAGEQSRIPRVSVLVRGHDGRVTGRSYEKVLGALSMKAFPQRDGRVRFEVIPQLEHGDPRSRFVAADGIIKPDYRPDAVVFNDLRLEAILSPGQMLVLGTRADRPGSLGNHFFTEQRSAQPLVQKLFLVRLAQAPSDDRFRKDEIPPASP